MPDVDSTVPGVITECANFIPYEAGMEGAPSGELPTDIDPLASTCFGAAVVTNLSGVRRILAGTATKLWDLTGGSWADVAGSAYAATADNRWTFTQFGNAALAANKANTLQRSTSGAFADVAGAPKAEIIFSVGAQVMALNVNDGTEKQDGWHCSALNDDTDWTPSLTTQAASGRLVSTAGALTAGGKLGEYAVAYKAKSIYLGRYVGTPTVWDWMQAPGGDAGCVGKEAMCDVGGAHFIVGDDNIWLFNGSVPVPIANDIRQWFYEHSSPFYRYRTQCVFDRQKNRVWVFFPSINSETCDEAIVYHLVTKRWGRATLPIEATMNYIMDGISYDTLDSVALTYDALPNIPYNSQFWLSGGQALSVVDDSHQFRFLTGEAGESSFMTGDLGDDENVTRLHEIRLRYAQGFVPDTATVQTYYKMNSGDDPTPGTTGDVLDGKFDVLQTARWHRAEFTFTGDVRVTAANGKLRPAGKR
jgi:hypothetical protein